MQQLPEDEKPKRECVIPEASLSEFTSAIAAIIADMDPKKTLQNEERKANINDLVRAMTDHSSPASEVVSDEKPSFGAMLHKLEMDRKDAEK